MHLPALAHEIFIHPTRPEPEVLCEVLHEVLREFSEIVREVLREVRGSSSAPALDFPLNSHTSVTRDHSVQSLRPRFMDLDAKRLTAASASASVHKSAGASGVREDIRAGCNSPPSKAIAYVCIQHPAPWKGAQEPLLIQPSCTSSLLPNLPATSKWGNN